MNYQNPEENELLSVEDEKVRQMCSGLKRIDAPKDFDFRLKARIANHQPQSEKSPIFAFLRRAAPLGLAVVVLALIVSESFYSVDNMSIPQIAGSFRETPKRTENFSAVNETPVEIASRESGPSANFETFTTSENSNSRQLLTLPANVRNEVGNYVKNLKNTNRAVETDGGGSRDSASRQTFVRVPQGFNSNTTVQTPNNVSNPTLFSVKEILSQIGITASFSGNGWRVQSVGQNSTAERSEIKLNDVIEAVDNIKILKEMILTNSLNVRKITVVRDGKRFEIELK